MLKDQAEDTREDLDATASGSEATADQRLYEPRTREQNARRFFRDARTGKQIPQPPKQPSIIETSEAPTSAAADSAASAESVAAIPAGQGINAILPPSEAPLQDVPPARIIQAAPSRAPQATQATPDGLTDLGVGQNILLCWLGKVDVGVALRHDPVNPGPIRMLLEHTLPFRRVVLLSTHTGNVLDTYRYWISKQLQGARLDIMHTDIRDLSTHESVCAEVCAVVESIIREEGLPANGKGITFHLSPGSPTTHAIMYLLCALRWPGITLVQTRLMGIGQAPQIDIVPIPEVTFKKDGTPDVPVRSDVGLPRPTATPIPNPQERAEAVYAETFSKPAPKPKATPQASRGPQEVELAEYTPPKLSKALGTIYRKLTRVAAMTLPILLIGDTGSGKSRLARYIHDCSGRTGRYVSLDCAGLTDESFTCELFGQVQGEHASAWRPRDGAFRLANSGTVFLENVNALSLTQQTMLLRILAPAGETRVNMPATMAHSAETVHVRIVASAGPDIIEKVRNGEFRTDLYYRLAGVSATLPTVSDYTREERENLLRSFLLRLQRRHNMMWNFAGDAWDALLSEEWPGNLREMNRMLQQICLLAEDPSFITREDVLLQLRQNRVTKSARQVCEPARQEYAASAQVSWQAPEAAVPSLSAEESVSAFGMTHAAGFGIQPTPEDVEEEAREKTAPEKPIFVLGSGDSIDAVLQKILQRYISDAMLQCDGKLSDAAKLLGISPQRFGTLLRQLRKKTASGTEEEA